MVMNYQLSYQLQIGILNIKYSLLIHLLITNWANDSSLITN